MYVWLNIQTRNEKTWSLDLASPFASVILGKISELQFLHFKMKINNNNDCVVTFPGFFVCANSMKTVNHHTGM